MGVSIYTLRHGHADARDKAALVFFFCVHNNHNVKKIDVTLIINSLIGK